MADPNIQVPADENLPAAQAAAIVQRPQNPEGPNPPNAAAEEVSLEVCAMFHLSLP